MPSSADILCSLATCSVVFACEQPPKSVLELHALTSSPAVAYSPKCQAVLAMIAQKLGNEDAALYRFTHPIQPAQPVTPPPPPALSNTVVERDPSGGATKQPLQQPSLSQPPRARPTQPLGARLGAPSHPPRKGAKSGPQYAAGNAKTPIMLAEIKVHA